MCRVLKGCRPGLRPEPFAEPLEASLKPLLFAAVALPLAWYHWRGRHSVPLPMPPALQAEKRRLESRGIRANARGAQPFQVPARLLTHALGE